MRQAPVRIYVAGPYTIPDPATNTRNAVLAADKLLVAGFAPFVPHLFHLWHLMSPKPYDEWLEFDLHWLRVCEAVFRLPGLSKGADVEEAEANRLNIPVYYSFDELIKHEIRQ